MKRNNATLLINETFVVGYKVEKVWCSWIENVYSRAIKDTGIANDIVFSKVLSNHNPDGNSYALQLKILEKDFGSYKNHVELTKVRSEMNRKFQNNIASFATILRVIPV